MSAFLSFAVAIAVLAFVYYPWLEDSRDSADLTFLESEFRKVKDQLDALALEHERGLSSPDDYKRIAGSLQGELNSLREKLDAAS